MGSFRRAPHAGSGSRGTCRARSSTALLAVSVPTTRRDQMAKVVIGVDPHKRINAVCVVDTKGRVLARRTFANSAGGFRELKEFWRHWRERRWAVEGCN